MTSHKGSFTVTTGRDGSRSFSDFGDKHKKYLWKRSKRYSGDRRHTQRGAWGPFPRARIDNDGDSSMSETFPASSSERFAPYREKKGRRKCRRPGKMLEMDKVRPGYSQNALKRLGLPFNPKKETWYRIRIPHGKKAGKDFIYSAIQRHIDVPFSPVQYRHENNSAEFYVSDQATANAIQQIQKKVIFPNGFKMSVVINAADPPTVYMNEDCIEKLKLCMSARYDSSTKKLNLSNLVNDEDLKRAGLFMPLNRTQVMSQVIKLIKEHIPELVSLDVSSNKLHFLDYFSCVVKSAPHVRHLNLGKNFLRSADELDRIKNWKLEELILDGNELCDRFRDRNEYISNIRKKFPNVLRLDGHELLPPIKFDLETTGELPPMKGSFFLNDNVKTLLVKFLHEYYTIFDSENRQALSNAYHSQAFFSLMAASNKSVSSKQPKFTNYITESRNMFLVLDDGKRHRLLKQGQLNIVSQLCLLPKTMHDMNSFQIDVNHLSANLLTFTVCGIFKETDSRSDVTIYRYFSRVFITTPLGNGIVVTNDMLSITNASPDQIQSAFKTPAPTPSSSPVQGVPAQPLAGPSTAVCSPREAAALGNMSPQRQLMVQQFIVESGMNQQYTFQCLQENDWNYEKSAQVFLDLKNQGKIPAAAFVH